VARTVLVVDDDSRMRDSLARALEGHADRLLTAATAEQALQLIAAEDVAVLLTDMRMPGMSGLDLLRLVRERSPGIDVLVMSAYEDLPNVAGAMQAGAVDFLVKPIPLQRLRDTLVRIFSDRLARRPRQEPKSAGATLLGRTPGMIEVFKSIGQAAASRATVLIRGESGTGKELVARAIHQTSAASAEQFSALNCAAVPSGLLESELFGHVRGAYTGAVGARRGRFAHAGRGTIFLDEIGDTSLELQAKLLRVIQEREYFPVGGERGEKTEARVVTATHRNLERLVSRGRFREDLYYRLRVVEIRIPPLRERVADIPLLAEHLLDRVSASNALKRPALERAAVERLVAHSWPGNVRELENCLTRAVVSCRGDVIHAEHIAFEAGAEPAGRSRTYNLAQAERRHIVQVLKAARGRKSLAARMLGVSRPRLDRLLRRHEIDILKWREQSGAVGSEEADS
jgi:two-component system, NtrC family, response regulator AtoC